jgi:hypothetical protein
MTVLFGLAMVPDALRALRYARETGGRFNQNGFPISSESHIIYVLYLLKDRLPPGTGPDVINPQMLWSWAYVWASAGEGRNVSGLPTEHASPQDPHPIFITRGSGLTVEQQKALTSTFHVEIYDDEVWVVDRRAPQAPLDAYAFEEREPSFWEWYFVSGIEPVRTYVRDSYNTWEWRTHLDQTAERPTASPKTLRQLRVAHNIAVAEGDTVSAARLQRQLEAALARDSATTFSQGIALLGFQRIDGTEPRIVLFFKSAGTVTSDATFSVRAVVERRKLLSLIPPDTVEREVAMPAALLTKSYRPGYIYEHTIVLRQRIGVERFWGAFQSKDGSAPPVRLDGRPHTPLLVLR